MKIDIMLFITRNAIMQPYKPVFIANSVIMKTDTMLIAASAMIMHFNSVIAIIDNAIMKKRKAFNAACMMIFVAVTLVFYPVAKGMALISTQRKAFFALKSLQLKIKLLLGRQLIIT